jgi:hypothetical protein
LLLDFALAIAQPRRPLLKSSSYIGSELLALTKQQPELQPLALLLGTCTQQAVHARALRLDCSRLARVLEQVRWRCSLTAIIASIYSASTFTTVQKSLSQVEAALVKLGSTAPLPLAGVAQLIVILDDACQVTAFSYQPSATKRISSSRHRKYKFNLLHYSTIVKLACAQLWRQFLSLFFSPGVGSGNLSHVIICV